MTQPVLKKTPAVSEPVVPAGKSLDINLVRRIPYAFSKSNGVILMGETEVGFQVGVRTGVQSQTLFELRRFLQRPLQLKEIPAAGFEALLNELYQSGLEHAKEIAEDLGEETDLIAVARSLTTTADLLDSDNDAPIVKLINALLTQALKEGVSDIHIEAFDSRVVVRFRMDGVLRDVIELQSALHGLIVSRIKIMSRLDIAEKRLPQDGRFSLRLAGQSVDVRVSTLPTGHGERVVMRLLDKQGQRLTLESLGMSPAMKDQFSKLIRQPHGIILVTGPTGSGKTTSLYAALSELNTKANNIMTVEDPIEYALDGVGQTQVNMKTNLTFARALRAILRQDPDVIMIGEIRDLETAQIAIQASLTGHLVLATLHTNDAVGAVTRLEDMGVEPFLLSSSLLGVVAQRLVRKLCAQCRREIPVTEELAHELEISADTAASMQIFTPVGCEACRRTGYQGRTGLYEMLIVDDALRTLVHNRAGEPALREYMRAHGLGSLRKDGMRWLQSGVTSVEEVLRVSSGDGV